MMRTTNKIFAAAPLSFFRGERSFFFAFRNGRSNHIRRNMSSSSSSAAAAPDDDLLFPVNIVQQSSSKSEKSLNWDDRIVLQNTFTLVEKGWMNNDCVEWKSTPYGVGLFARQDIAAEQVLRRGILGRNLIQFHNVQNIENFLNQGDKSEYEQRLRYVADYLWGFDEDTTDPRGYASTTGSKQQQQQQQQAHSFMGMWIPGNGLNHSTDPSMVYRKTKQGLDLVALKDIKAGEELYDDYRRHGVAPQWLLEFAAQKKVQLNFAGCNDFVEKE